MGSIDAPEPLAEHHDISQFRSDVPGLDAWLQGKARLNDARGGARTYVACVRIRVIGFYRLAAHTVEPRPVPSRVGRSMPVPVILRGQLAVDTDCRGRGLGSGLLVDAAKRALPADEFASRAIVVQALDERAKSFHGRFGFRLFSEREPLMLLLRISEPRAYFRRMTQPGHSKSFASPYRLPGNRMSWNTSNTISSTDDG